MSGEIAWRPIERRVLAYLDQRGAMHRATIVHDLSPEGSRVRTRKQGGGSNGGIPLLMGAWCKRLLELHLVSHDCDKRGFYRSHSITSAGRDALRSIAESTDA